MKRTYGTLAAALLTAHFAGCDSIPTIPDGSGQPVIEAFLYAGEPITDIRVTSTVALGSADTVGLPINDAQVALIKGGHRYPLNPSGAGDGYYRYIAKDLSVNEGDVFGLEVQVGSVTATAQTVVPNRPDTLTLSADSLVIPNLGAGRGGGGGLGGLGTQLVARWPNPRRELFYVTIENIEASPSPVTGLPGGGGAFRRFIFAPISADNFAISPLSLAYYGRHEVRVYRVNAEYAALYESRQQDTRDLNEPASNIHGALGVFSAFSSRVAYFRAIAAQ